MFNPNVTADLLLVFLRVINVLFVLTVVGGGGYFLLRAFYLWSSDHPQGTLINYPDAFRVWFRADEILSPPAKWVLRIEAMLFVVSLLGIVAIYVMN